MRQNFFSNYYLLTRTFTFIQKRLERKVMQRLAASVPGGKILDVEVAINLIGACLTIGVMWDLTCLWSGVQQSSAMHGFYFLWMVPLTESFVMKCLNMFLRKKRF